MPSLKMENSNSMIGESDDRENWKFGFSVLINPQLDTKIIKIGQKMTEICTCSNFSPSPQITSGVGIEGWLQLGTFRHIFILNLFISSDKSQNHCGGAAKHIFLRLIARYTISLARDSMLHT